MHRPIDPAILYFGTPVVLIGTASLHLAGHRNRVDPDRWRPLIMSFQNFYGLGPGHLQPSRLATIPEDRYRP